jgi:hypothetical protein
MAASVQCLASLCRRHVSVHRCGVVPFVENASGAQGRRALRCRGMRHNLSLLPSHSDEN